MRVRAFPISLVLLAGCAPPPPESPTTIALPPPAEPVVSAAPAPPAPPPPIAATAPVEPTAAAISDACHGADLDLDVILGGQACDVKREASAPPPSDVLGLELVPARTQIKPGDEVGLTVAFVNRGGSVLEVDLNVSCGKEFYFEVEAVNAKGQRADQVGGSCAVNMLCSRRTIHVPLAPGGRLHTQLAFKAIVTKPSALCEWRPAGPLRLGAYTLRVTTPLRDPDPDKKGATHARTVEAPITVAR